MIGNVQSAMGNMMMIRICAASVRLAGRLKWMFAESVIEEALVSAALLSSKPS